MAIGAMFFVSSAIRAAAARRSALVGRPGPPRADPRRSRLSIPAALTLPSLDGRRALAALVVAATVAFGIFCVLATALVADGAEAAWLASRSASRS